ncbi:MAG: hypothetical protein J4478_05040 [Candidatus Diapherotrites archaeon]|uniref:Class III signal peptide-containing protein n=1 Tax=Candidatus Iainarchaeum sp. TaxID=3101447 RepID=A0A8T4L703_9ARCH|nr:hypothetical protein [Candidatus Diapherotrites archaeon]
MDSKAQTSFEYLLTVAFGVVLVIAALAIALQLGNLAAQSQARVKDYRSSTISSLIKS